MFVLILISFIIAFSGCEDSASTDYTSDVIIEGFLLVDQPIDNITVMMSQPINSNFNYSKSLIRDAKVRIIGDNQVFNLVIDPVGERGYYNPDNNYLVKPHTEYKLEVEINGKVVTGKTITPNRVSWVNRTPKIIQYPKDTLKLPSTYNISWTKVDTTFNYIIQIKCLDTLNYGKYLLPATNEMNRRAYNMNTKDHDGPFHEMSMKFMISNTETSVVWFGFIWFGLHEVTLYSPDENMAKWFLQQTQVNQYEPLLNSLDNGKGCFGSASCVKDTTFVLKNQQ